MRFSILVPALNPGKYGPIAIASALSQLGPEDELLIQDGGSTDGWLDQLPSDVRLKTEVANDGGQTAALNRALNRATGDYVGWLNADDTISPGALATVQAELIASAADIVYGGWALVNSEGDVVRLMRPPDTTRSTLLHRGCCLFSGATFVRRALLVDMGGFSPDYAQSMDYEMFLRLLSAHGVRTARIDAVLAAFRIHSGAKSSRQRWNGVREGRRARRTHSVNATERATAEVATIRHVVVMLARPIRWSSLYIRLRRGGAPIMRGARHDQ